MKGACQSGVPFILAKVGNLLFAAIKRYSFVSLLIVACFLSAFVALYNGVTSMLQLTRMIQEENEYQYLHTVQVTIMLSEPLDVDKLYQLVQGVDVGNIVIHRL